VSTFSELIKKQGVASHADVEWLNLLVADWQLIADLVFADLILWVPTKDNSFVAVAHARPSSAATLFYRDISGELVRKQWLPQIQKAFSQGETVELRATDRFDNLPARVSAIPVRRRLSTKSEEVTKTAIAVVTKHTNLAEAKAPNKLFLNYENCGNELLQMVADGTFPDFATPTGPRRGAPRANDGLIRLDSEGMVQFASPNGLSVFNRLGVAGELEGRSLAQAVTPVLKGQHTVDEGLPLVVSGRAPWRADLDSRLGTMTIRAIPLKRKGERTGAIVLCRDVTELRRQERELITKDATIREIHHRVKNNLQTVASLLRIQARRSGSEEVKESLEQAMRRVAAIALVHDTLSEGLDQDLNFDEVFDRVLGLVSELAAGFNATVRTIVDGKFGQLRSDLATPLAVVLTELVSNSIEHGFANSSGVVAVNAERRAKKLDITVSDNGKGFAEGKLGNGLGTQIIKALVEGELRGSIHWSAPAEGGVRVFISIPL
jgi:two-component sensor histidine kinase/PAS domain-containing protein